MMHHIVESQDKIGWRRFTEGCISKEFHRRQTLSLLMTNNRLNGKDWTKQLISRLLQITLSQWIYIETSCTTIEQMDTSKIRQWQWKT
jgi:hypothetical protein